MKSTQQNLHDVLAEARRFASPRAEDRTRATRTLEAQLGPEVVHDVSSNGAVASGMSSAPAPDRVTPGAAPASRLAPSARLPAFLLRPSGALSAGVALVGLGFAIGYGVGARTPAISDKPPSAVALPTPPASGPPRDVASSSMPPAPLPPAPSAALPPANAKPASTAATPSPRGPSAAPLRRAPRSGANAANADPLTLREVLARLRQAHAALEGGRAALALIELAALDRSGGELLREEREVTRVLAFCALGDTEGARAAARALSARPDSIYARRLEASCAGEGLPARR